MIIFFGGSIFLLATILPWNLPSSESPYVAAFEQMHIGFAAG